MPDCSQRLAEVLKRYRLDLDLTQDEVADKSHIDTRSVINMEMGRGNPQLKTLYPVIQALKIDPREIFEDAPPEEAVPVRRLRQLVEECTEEEAAALVSVIEAVLSALRSKHGINIEE